MLGLLLACKQLNADTWRMVEAWSPNLIIRDPAALDSLSDLDTRCRFKLGKLSLLIFDSLNDIGEQLNQNQETATLLSYAGLCRSHALFEEWTTCVPHLPVQGVSEVIIDLTLGHPCRPGDMNGGSLATFFLSERQKDVVGLIGLLDVRYNRDSAGQRRLPGVKLAIEGIPENNPRRTTIAF